MKEKIIAKIWRGHLDPNRGPPIPLSDALDRSTAALPPTFKKDEKSFPIGQAWFQFEFENKQSSKSLYLWCKLIQSQSDILSHPITWPEILFFGGTKIVTIKIMVQLFIMPQKRDNINTNIRPFLYYVFLAWVLGFGVIFYILRCKIICTVKVSKYSSIG